MKRPRDVDTSGAYDRNQQGSTDMTDHTQQARAASIPDAAIEAAVDALIDSKLGDHPGINGEEFVEAAYSALEAAAPYMQAPILALMDDPEHYDTQGPSSGYVSVDHLRAALDISNAALEAATSSIVRKAITDELAELAALIEPYSGIGLANGATRSEVAQWIRKRAEEYRGPRG